MGDVVLILNFINLYITSSISVHFVSTTLCDRSDSELKGATWYMQTLMFNTNSMNTHVLGYKLYCIMIIGLINDIAEVSDPTGRCYGGDHVHRI